MFSKLRGISALRQSLKGHLFKENLKSRKAMSTVERCESKADDSKNCCRVKCMMDEICHPEGSWSENFKRRTAIRNRVLYTGLALFIGTSILMKNAEMVKGHPYATLF